MALVCYRKHVTFSRRCPELLVTAFSVRKFGFDPGAVLVRFAVDTLTLGVVFFSPNTSGFSPVSVIPPALHTLVHFNSTLIRTSETSNKPTVVLISDEKLDRQVL